MKREDELRVAIGGISHETNTFSPLRTTTADFRRVEGTALFEERFGGPWAAENVTLHPAFTASAFPGGLVLRADYQRLRDDLLRQFRAALPLDGVHLDLHGAMHVEGIGDGESDLIRAVRDLVGPETRIAVSLDLHGNISPTLVEQADILTAYRTAPHRDGPETRRRALRLLVRSLREGLQPAAAMVKLPLLLAGESALTEVEPARSLYAGLEDISEQPGLMDASLLIGCAWTDSPYTSVSAIVVAENDMGLARHHAVQLAGEVWARRGEFGYAVESAPVDEAIRTAMDAKERPVFLSDSGDNVTAGGAGDIPLVAERLLATGAQEVLVAGLTDPQAVQQCAAAGEGAKVHLSIGGKLDRANGRPLEVSARVQRLSRAPRDPAGVPTMALIRTAGVSILLAADRRSFSDRASIAAAGIDPMQQKVVVVKLGLLMPDLYDHAPRAIMALSPGATDLRLEQLPYKRIARPIYPLDGDLDWTPA